jgi:hypothetical protein
MRDDPNWRATSEAVRRYTAAINSLAPEFMKAPQDRDRELYDELERKMHAAAADLELQAPGILGRLHGDA